MISSNCNHQEKIVIHSLWNTLNELKQREKFWSKWGMYQGNEINQLINSHQGYAFHQCFGFKQCYDYD